MSIHYAVKERSMSILKFCCPCWGKESEEEKLIDQIVVESYGVESFIDKIPPKERRKSILEAQKSVERIINENRKSISFEPEPNTFKKVAKQRGNSIYEKTIFDTKE